jgi:CRISPR-associated exonuclease Cas4
LAHPAHALTQGHQDWEPQVNYLSILLLTTAVLLFILSYRKRRQSGLPAGRVIYSDTSTWGKLEKPLYDPDIRLTGKPDYLIKQGRYIIPVEVKSVKSLQQPFDSHIYQLAAYCLLVEHEYNIAPKYGIIHYPEQTFAIDFTRPLKSSLKATIAEMQTQFNSHPLVRSHQEVNRCQRCGYRSVCDQALRI